MHELSLAEDILTIVENHARTLGSVSSVTLAVGTLATIEIDSLEFCLNSVFEGSKAAGAEIRIERVDAVGRCPACGVEQAMETRYSPCAGCGAFGLELLSGDGIHIRAISGAPAPDYPSGSQQGN